MKRPSTFVQDRLKDLDWLADQAAKRLGGPVRLFSPGSYFQAFHAIVDTADPHALGPGARIVNLSQETEIHLGLQVLHLRGGGALDVVRIKAPHHARFNPGYDFLHYVLEARYEELRDRVRAVGGAEAKMPFLVASDAEEFRSNTLGFLERSESVYATYDIPFRRGVILSGPPGNGKTMACRWLVRKCMAAGFLHRVVAPQDYLDALKTQGGVTGLFRFEDLKSGVDNERPKGVIVFDDIDIALRHREDSSIDEGWHQATFLSHLEGVERPEGVVYVFTTNCGLDQIDKAILRPGRIDAVLRFDPPTDELIKQFVWKVWPVTVTENLPEDAHEALSGKSYAAIDEVKRLFVLRYLDGDGWDWASAVERFGTNRQDMDKVKVDGLAASRADL